MYCIVLRYVCTTDYDKAMSGVKGVLPYTVRTYSPSNGQMSAPFECRVAVCCAQFQMLSTPPATVKETEKKQTYFRLVAITYSFRILLKHIPCRHL